MKILIGTPVHEVKDYAMEKWLDSISKLTYPFDLLMVDNSENKGYQNTIRKYCKKNKVSNYKLIHVNVSHRAILEEKLTRSRECIRQEFLNGNYDAWFSLECDIIVPPDTLTKLVGLLSNYWMVRHTYPARDFPHMVNSELGISLVRREALQKYGFENQYGFVDDLNCSNWYGSDVWFIVRLVRDSKAKIMTISGKVNPIFHLTH